MRIIVPIMLVSLATTPLQAEPEREWKTSLAIGFNTTDGNSKQLTANTTLTIDYRKTPLEFSFLAEGNYGEAETTADDGTTSTDTTIRNARNTGNLKYRWSRTYLYANTTSLHDDIAGIEYRWTAGPGIGYFLLDHEGTRLSVEAGITYIRESLDTGNNTSTGEDIPALRLAHRLEHSLSKTAKLWEAIEYLPDLGEFDAYLLNVEAGVEASLTKLGALRMVFQNKYDSVPPPDRESNDLSIVASLVFKH